MNSLMLLVVAILQINLFVL